MKKRVDEVIRFFHILFVCNFKLLNKQTETLGNFGQPMSILRDSVPWHPPQWEGPHGEIRYLESSEAAPQKVRYGYLGTWV